MSRKLSSIAPEWWDYTTIDTEIVKEAAKLTPEALLKLSRPGFKIVFYDTSKILCSRSVRICYSLETIDADNPVEYADRSDLRSNCRLLRE